MKSNLLKLSGVALATSALGLVGCGDDTDRDNPLVHTDEARNGITSEAALPDQAANRTAYTSEDEARQLQEADETLQRQIEEELAANLSQDQLDQIEIRVQEGDVELAGVVQNADAAEELANQVRAMEGVTNVHNYLQVTQR